MVKITHSRITMRGRSRMLGMNINHPLLVRGYRFLYIKHTLYVALSYLIYAKCSIFSFTVQMYITCDKHIVPSLIYTMYTIMISDSLLLLRKNLLMMIDAPHPLRWDARLLLKYNQHVIYLAVHINCIP